MITAIAAAVVFTAGFVNGLLGFGSGIVAMTVLALTHGLIHAASLVNLLSVSLSVIMAWMLRGHIRWRLLVPILPTGVLGVVGGVLLLGAVNEAIAIRALGVVVIAFAAWNLFGGGRGLTRALGPAWGAAAGAASGVLQGAMNTGGPPIVAYLYGRPDSPETIKATAQVVFVVFGLIRALAATSQGMFTEAVWLDFAVTSPGLVAGILAGMSMGRRVSAQRFRRLSWWAFGAMGAVLLR